MNVLRFYVLFKSNSVIKGRLEEGNKRLCAMEPCLRLERFQPPARLELSCARSVSQRLTHWAIGAPGKEELQ